MQLRTAGDRNVLTSGAQETRAFSIKANGKAFRILLDGLYSDKILAIVRELCTNAFDAHLDGKNPEAFQVHVPSRWEPHFFVRDFGCSMTHEQVMGLYTTVFDSTKDGRNDAVGAFGLGSKSPFAYGDTFQVTVWKDGEKRVYNAVIGTDGTPEISLFGRIASTEPTGVMVGFPVKLEDVDAFKKAIKRVYCGFSQPFDLLNIDREADEFKRLRAVKPARAGTDWFLYDTNFNDVAGVSGLLARQGCVIYPIEVDKITATAAARGQSATLDLFKTDWRGDDRYTAILDFSIGELSVAANRESLAYDNATVTAIVDRLALFSADMVKDAEKILSVAKTPMEMVAAFDGLKLGGKMRNLIGRTVKFRGELVHAIVDRFVHGSRHDGHRLASEYGLAMCHVKPGASRPSFRAALQVTVSLRGNPFFVADPGTIGRATNRVATALEDADARPTYWIRPSSTSMSEADFYAAVRKLLDTMTEGLTFRKIEEFDPAKLGKGPGIRGDYTPFRAVDLHHQQVVELTEHEPEDGGLYVLMRHNQFVWKAGDGSTQLLSIQAIGEIVRTVDQACGTAYYKANLIGIIGNSHSIPEKNTGWTSLQDALVTAMATTFDKARFENTLRKQAVKNMEGTYGSGEYNLIHNADWLARNVKHAELASIAGQKTTFEGLPVFTPSQLITLQRYMGLAVPENAQEQDAPYVTLAKRLVMQYPLLGALEFRRATGLAIEQYIIMVDQASAANRGDKA